MIFFIHFLWLVHYTEPQLKTIVLNMYVWMLSTWWYASAFLPAFVFGIFFVARARIMHSAKSLFFLDKHYLRVDDVMIVQAKSTKLHRYFPTFHNLPAVRLVVRWCFERRRAKGKWYKCTIPGTIVHCYVERSSLMSSLVYKKMTSVPPPLGPRYLSLFFGRRFRCMYFCNDIKKLSPMHWYR